MQINFYNYLKCEMAERVQNDEIYVKIKYVYDVPKIVDLIWLGHSLLQ